MSDLPTLHICTTCRPAGEADDGPRPGEVLSNAVAELLAGDAQAPCHLNPVVCLASCERACTAVLSQAGKWAYIVGELNPEHAADLIAYARAYGASTAGIVLRSGRPASLHHNIIARVPALAPAFKDAAQ